MIEGIDQRRITPFNPESDFDENHKLKADAPVYSPFTAHQPSTPWD